MKCPYCGAEINPSNGNRCSRFPICLFQDRDIPVNVNSYIMYDLETTGFSDSRDKIIEIGAISVKNGKIVDRFSELCNPGKFVSQKITDLTGITNEMLEDVMSSEEGVQAFINWVKIQKENLAIGHNIASFDNRMLKAACRRQKLEFPFEFTLDTLTFAKNLQLKERGLVQGYKQGQLGEFYGIKYDAHRAVNDVEALHEIFSHLLQDSQILGKELPIIKSK